MTQQSKTKEKMTTKTCRTNTEGHYHEQQLTTRKSDVTQSNEITIKSYKTLTNRTSKQQKHGEAKQIQDICKHRTKGTTLELFLPEGNH